MKTTIISILTTLGLYSNAFAATSTNEVYTSGLLVFLFLGLCAMIVAVQCIPAIITLYGILKATFSPSVKTVRDLS